MAVSLDGEALYFKDPSAELLSLPKREDFLDLERQPLRTGSLLSPGVRFFDLKQVPDGRLAVCTAPSSALSLLSLDLHVIESVAGFAPWNLKPDLLPRVCFSATGTDAHLALWNAGHNRLFVVDLHPRAGELEEVPLVLHKDAEVFMGLTAQSGRQVLVGYRVGQPEGTPAHYYLSYWEKSLRTQTARQLLRLESLDARGSSG